MKTNNDNTTDWSQRPSHFEMFVGEALDLSYEVASQKKISSENMHYVVTRAIASMPSVSELSNIKLLEILFEYKSYEEEKPDSKIKRFKPARVDKDPKRLVRHFRNAERSLKISTASSHIVSLLNAKVIEPFEGGRLWYVSLVFCAAIKVINGFMKSGNVDFDFQKNHLIADACFMFESLLEESTRRSRLLPEHYPSRDVQQFMNYCAYTYFTESDIKRNPWVSIKRICEISEVAPGNWTVS
jgi:hypothetical protein